MSIGWRIYNDALHQRICYYQENGKGLSWQDQVKLWLQYRNQHDELKVLPAVTVVCIIRRLDKSYQAFFKRRSDGVGFPKQRKRKDFKTLEYRYNTNGTGNGCKLKFTEEDRAKLYIMNVGEIKVHAHREFPENARIKQILVSIDKEQKYWASVQIEVPNQTIPEHTGSTVGIDVGLVYLLALSNGLTVENPRWYKQAQKERRVLGRKLNRQLRACNPQNYNENGTVKENAVIWRKSNRMRDTETELRKLESKITRQRKDFWDRITDELTKTYSMIALEDLTLEFMQQNKRLSMSAYDASFGIFWRMLEYKAKRTGTRLVWVDPKYTSQTCPECGFIHKENRKTQANFTCLECGYHENADIVGAKNILARGWVSLYNQKTAS
jgi:putative transposase